jgi:hypothetical protein
MPCEKPEHEEFARRLALHGNATAAYKATYGCANDNSAGANACRLAKHPDVARRVRELRLARHEQLLADTENLEILVSNLCMGKGGEIVDENGKPVPLHELPAHVKAAIAGVDLDLDDDGNVTKYKIRFPDPLQAMRLLAQLRGQLVERKDVTSGGRSLPPFVDPKDLPATDAELRRRLIREPAIDAEFSELPADWAELL